MALFMRSKQRSTPGLNSKAKTTRIKGDVHDHSRKYNDIQQQRSDEHRDDTTNEAGRTTPTIQVNGVDLHKANGDVKQANGSVRNTNINTPNGDFLQLLKRERDMNKFAGGSGNSNTTNDIVSDDQTPTGISREQHHMQNHVGMSTSKRDNNKASDHGFMDESDDGYNGVNASGESRKVDKGKALVSKQGTPKGKSGRPNGSVTFAEDVGREPERREFSSPGTSRNSTFKNAVRRHFGKDRLYYLVQSLLSSVEEEKTAHQDLINSFETARQIQVPVCVHAPYDQPEHPSVRHKRVRRRSEVLLADKIKLDRIASRNNSLTGVEESVCVSEPNEAYSEPKEDVVRNEVRKDSENGNHVQGELSHASVTEEKCDLKYQQIDQDNSEESLRTEAGGDIRPNSEALIQKEDTLNECESSTGQLKKDDSAKSLEEETRSGNIPDKDSDPHIIPDGSTQCVDETNDSYLDEIPDETKELDQLILESIRINSPSEDSDSCESRSSDQDLGDVVVIALESSSDDNDEACLEGRKQLGVYYLKHQEEPFGYYKGECVIELVGRTGTMDKSSSDEDDSYNRVEIEDLGDDESDSDLRYLNEKVACISTVEYERKRRNKLRPTLGSIKEAEASLGSFQSIQTKSSSSSEKPEVISQCANSPITNGDSCDSDSGILVYRNKPKPDSETKADRRINVDEITSEVNVVFVTSDDDTSDVRRDDNHEDNTINVRRHNKQYTNDKMQNGRHDESQDSSDNETVPSVRSEKDTKDTNYDDAPATKVHKTPTKRPKSKKSSKQNRSPPKIISIDLIDVYNENKDLQRVDTSDGVPRTRKRTKNTSPRTKSPRAKITKHTKHKKNDNVPLPPKPYPVSPRQVRAVSCPPKRPEPDPDTVRRMAMFQYYRSYQSRKDSSLYEQPDFILWNRLDLSSRCKSAVEHYGRREGVDRAGEEEGGRSLALLQQREREAPNTCKVWDMPITEAVKRVKSGVKNVPKPRDMEDTTPRHVRVQQMYAHLKKIRRSAGYTTYKPLVSMTQRPSDFRP